MRGITERLDVRVSVIYGGVALLWIIFSDTLIDWLFAANQPLLLTIGTLKGVGFVVITTLVLFAVLSAERRKRQQVEEALRESNNRFETLFRHSPDAMFLMDFSTLTIIDCNEVACQMNGYTREELIGHSIDMLNVTPNADDVSFGLKERLRREGVLHLQQDHRRKDGSIFTIDNSVCHLTIAGRELIMGIDRDITERKRLEEERMVAQQLQMELLKEKELSELKGRFIAMVSHEYRTPLAVILSSTDLLGSYGDRLPLDRKQRLLDDIHAQVNYMVKLLQDVLTINKAQTGKLTLNLTCIDLRAYCQGILETVQRADNGAHQFKLVTASEPVGTAKVDDHLLQQILINLLSNSAKYSPHSTEICLELEREERHLVFRVKDHGIGIPPADQVRLFEPFHRATNVGTTPGTGLGLSIVKHIVDALGGTIWFTSDAAAGTTFTVHLPILESGDSSKT